MYNALAGVIICLLLLTACSGLPDRLVWSPDGRKLAVLDLGGIRLGNESGELGERKLNKSVQLLRWRTDSRHALIVWSEEVKKWQEIKDLFSKKEILKISRLAERIWRSGRLPKKSQETELQNPWGAPPQALALLYLKQKYGPNTVKQKIGKQLEKESNLDSVSVNNIQPVDLEGKEPLGKILWRTTDRIDDVRISPNGKLAAVSMNQYFSFYKIVLVPLGDGTPKTVIDSLADLPDWSPDSKSLFYISYPKVPPNSSRKELFADEHPWTATLNRLEVANETGEILSKLAASQKLLQVLAAHSSRVRCLNDGSIIFNSKQRQFPSRVDATAKAGFFRLKPDLQTVEPIGTLNHLEGDKLSLFEPNQDGSKIAVAQENGEIQLLDVSSGKVTILEDEGKDLKFLPQWRTKDELCYPSRNAKRETNGHDAEVMLQTVTEPTHRVNLSKTWPNDSADFLQDEDESYPLPKLGPKTKTVAKPGSTNRNLDNARTRK